MGSNGFIGGGAAGDLAFIEDEIFWSSVSGDLLALSLAPVSGRNVGDMGRGPVFALGTPNRLDLYGAHNTEIFTIDPLDASNSVLFDYGGNGLRSANGAAFFTEATAVPEPSCVAIGLFAVGISIARRRRKRTMAH